MKTKLVFKGTNENDEKILLALALRAEDNMVDIHVFSGDQISDEFAKRLHEDWRNGKEVEFPAGHEKIERELTVSGPLLPDNIKVEQGDILNRAQTEWHFVVLSSKLNDAYQAELNELKEKIEQLSRYDSQVWDSLKTFWSKVQEQVRDRNLFREHANTLRDNTNTLFTRLKEMRAALDEEFQQVSNEQYQKFTSTLEDIEGRVKADTKLQGIFDELKNLQKVFKDTKLTREHRSKIWERLDAAFKTVKEKRFGPNSGSTSPYERLQRRYNGLLSAIQKMEGSIKRDKDDLNFQNRKIEQTDGQLEAQIRQAKIKMIEERVRSKEEKLKEMHQTREELEKRLEVLKEKEAKRAEKSKIEAARIAAKEKIQNEIKEAEKARGNDTHIQEAVEAAENAVEAISDSVTDIFEDVVDTVKAVAEVVGGKIEEAVVEAKQTMEVVAKDITEASVEANDLKAIEGIGPKIEQILNEAGIKSYTQLSNSTPEKVKEILSAAGKRYAAHDPTTWPKQAAMAAAGDWDKLKAWQDELDGGRIVKNDNSEEE